MFSVFNSSDAGRPDQAHGPDHNPGGQDMNQQQTPEQPYRQPENPSPQGYPPHTGAPYPAVENSRRKSGVLAMVLSLFPGLGQIYVGYYQLGFSFALTAITIIAMLNSDFGRGKEPFLGTFLAFFWLFNLVDANRRAQHYNRFMAGQQGSDVPEGFKSAGGIGSVPVGVILVLVGILIIMDLNFGVSMEWLENWWPLAMVVFGGWLIFKGRQSD